MPVATTPAAGSSSTPSSSLKPSDLVPSSWRMSQDSSPAPADGTLPPSSIRWPKSGIYTSSGVSATQGTSESRNAGAASSLSQLLVQHAAPRFFLSPKAASGILRRANKRGRTLPGPLQEALLAVADSPPTTAASPASAPASAAVAQTLPTPRQGGSSPLATQTPPAPSPPASARASTARWTTGQSHIVHRRVLSE